jgi:mannitol-1-/sugar-/sorbitol-6-phosphatase
MQSATGDVCYGCGMSEILCAGVLFDLDGVLIDSTPAVARVWTKWAKEHGFDPAEVVRKAHGRPSMATIREYLPNADAEAENKVVERGELNDLDGIVPLPGAKELLAALPAELWAIVTSGTRALAETRLRAAGLKVPATMVTANDVKRGKPDPEPYVKGASLLGFPAAECVVVEDAPSGVRAGKAAGARVIAVLTTATEQEVRDAGADWVVRDCTEIRVKSGRSLELIVEDMGVRKSENMP